MADNKQKQARKAAALLDPQVRVLDIVRGRANWRWTTAAKVYLGVFVFAFVIALLMGRILVPGGALAILAILSARPYRWVAITDHGTAVFNTNLFGGAVKGTEALIGRGALQQIVKTTGSSVVVQLGAERVTLRRKDYDAIVRHDVPAREHQVAH